MAKLIHIDGLEVELTKKRIKRINLRVKGPDGRIVVSSPYSVPDREVISFIRSRRGWIEKSIETVRARAAANPEPQSAEEKETRRTELKKRIAKRLPGIEEATGLRSSGWTVRDMRTRWGSCNTVTHHLNFSLMLATRSDIELDYVILHELVHTVVPNHGPEFYALMDKFMPGWKKIRRDLHK